VDHISFAVHRGEVFGFLGPNGAGKTTTQRMLTTLLEPSEGRIVINGHDLAHDAYAAERHMGLVPEESNVYAVAYLSPLTYVQDLMNRAMLEAGLLPPWLDLVPLMLAGLVFLAVSMRMHERSRRLGY
jgi:ABC-type Na+ transport system ATPase subunit NatA